MKKTCYYIVALIVLAAFAWPVIAVGQDVILTSDGKVPGKPFQALQDQIDYLQQQINDIQTGSVKGFVTRGGLSLPPNEDMDVMTLSLPRGKFINTFTISAGYPPPGQEGSSSSLQCALVYSETHQVIQDGLGCEVFGQNSFAVTFELETSEESNDVILRCNSFPLGTPEYDMGLYHTEWTAIKVDELDRQN